MPRRFLLLLSAATVLLLSACTHRSEVVVSEGSILKDGWLRLSPESKVATTGPVSEIFIVFPESSALRSADRELVDGKGDRVVVEGYVETVDGRRINLVPSPMELGQTLMLEMTSPALEWSKNEWRIKSVMLRSNVPVATTKIIWVSDDPKDHKDGLVLPKDL
jgi:hypothetical protein